MVQSPQVNNPLLSETQGGEEDSEELYLGSTRRYRLNINKLDMLLYINVALLAYPCYWVDCYDGDGPE